MWKDSITNNTRWQTTAHLIPASSLDWNEADQIPFIAFQFLLNNLKKFPYWTASMGEMCAEQMFPCSLSHWLQAPINYLLEQTGEMPPERTGPEKFGTFLAEKRFWINEIYDKANVS